MRIIACLLLLGATSLVMAAASAQADWQPYAMRSAEAWVFGTDDNEPYGALTISLVCRPDGNVLRGIRVGFDIDFPEMEISSAKISTHEPVLVGDHRTWRHLDDTPVYLVQDEYGLKILMDNWTRSEFAAPYVILKRGPEFALLRDGPSEYDMFSNLRLLPVSTNILNLHVLNYDEQRQKLYLTGSYFPNGALFKTTVESGVLTTGETPPGAKLTQGQRQLVLVEYDTISAAVTLDYMSQDFRPLFGKDGVIIGLEDKGIPFSKFKREPLSKLVYRNCADPATAVSSQVLALREGEGIEKVYPWKTGELLVITLRSVYRYVESTGELTYLLDLVQPAQQAMAQAQAADQADADSSEN